MPNSTNTPSLTNAPATDAALDQLRAELNAMPEDEILRDTRASPDAAAAIAEAAAAKVMPYRGELMARFGPESGERLDKLPICARATTQASVEARVMSPSKNLSSRHEEARAHYEVVSTELESLVHRKVLDPAVLNETRDIQGYDALMKSTRAAVLVAHTHWSEIEGKTQLTPEMLDAATASVDALYRAMLDRDHGVSRSPAIELRVRALSMLLHVYDEVRREVTYLRWHQRDYDTLAPSPYTRLGRSRSSTNDEVEDLEDETDVTDPTPTPADDGGPFTS